MQRKISELPVGSGDPLWPLGFVDIRFEPHDPTAGRVCSDQNPCLRDRRKTLEPDGQSWNGLLLVIR